MSKSHDYTFRFRDCWLLFTSTQKLVRNYSFITTLSPQGESYQSAIMRGLSLLPLDDDIVDRILTFLPDFSTLGAIILTSQHFYNVFKIHSNSIIRAVAYNITGPALPQAISLLRSPSEPNAWLETDPVSPITGLEAQSLVKNATVVAALENLFSSRQVPPSI